MIFFYFVCPYEDMKARIQIPVHKHSRAHSVSRGLFSLNHSVCVCNPHREVLLIFYDYKKIHLDI